MQATCPNPGCGATYTIGAEHVGHRSICRKCGAAFVIEATGLRLDTPAHPSPAPAAPPAMPVAAPVRPAPVAQAGDGGGIGQFLADPFTWCVLVGTIIVLVFTFLHVLDGLKVGRINAQISYERSDRSDPDSPSSPRGKNDRIKALEKDLKEAELSAGASPYIYGWFYMVGFLVLTVGATGFVAMGATKAKRVVGGVLLCAELLIMFMLVTDVTHFLQFARFMVRLSP